jgi:predicted nucleic acid-binding protein
MDVVTLDTGALIALERNKARARALVRAVILRDARLFVPAPVVTEWWRGRTDVRDDILALLVLAPVTREIACAAGEALARTGTRTRGTSAVDAIVMAQAASRGGVVYTSDVDDLGILRDACFPSVRVLAI